MVWAERNATLGAYAYHRELEIPVVFGFRAPVPGYQMGPYAFVVGPNKLPCAEISAFIAKHPAPNIVGVFTLSPSAQSVQASSSCVALAPLSIDPFCLNFGEWTPPLDTLPFIDRTDVVSAT